MLLGDLQCGADVGAVAGSPVNTLCDDGIRQIILDIAAVGGGIVKIQHAGVKHQTLFHLGISGIGGAACGAAEDNGADAVAIFFQNAHKLADQLITHVIGVGVAGVSGCQRTAAVDNQHDVVTVTAGAFGGGFCVGGNKIRNKHAQKKRCRNKTCCCFFHFFSLLCDTYRGI